MRWPDIDSFAREVALPPDQSHTPPREAMPPRVAALADFVYGPTEEAPA